MFRASSCPSSVAQQQQKQPLVDRWNMVVAVLLVVVGPAGRPARPRPTTLLPLRSNGKPEAATAVVELLMMGIRMPETCWAVFKRQTINLRNCCIWLVDSFEYMMMHGLTNPKKAVLCLLNNPIIILAPAYHKKVPRAATGIVLYMHL
jgi:hypothetical protein